MKTQNSLIENIVEGALKDKIFTSIQIKVTRNGRTFYEHRFGKKYRYFDLASVTKFFVTTPLIMILVNEKKIALDDVIAQHLLVFERHPLGKVKIRRLLDQTSGLVWWRPFYKALIDVPKSEREYQLKKLFLRERVNSKKTCVYSDLNFILLKWIIEEKLKMPLDLAFQEKIAEPLGLHETFFIKRYQVPFKKKLFAPTEKTKARGVVQGYVHDDNCESFGGVSGHAGLFSTLDDASKLAEEWLSAYNGRSRALFGKAIFRQFATRAMPKSRGDWGLGMMVPSSPISTGGSLIHRDGFGFPGFTGPSVWIDPKRGTTVTILTNRTFPNRDNPHFAPIRRQLHDIIWESIDGSQK